MDFSKSRRLTNHYSESRLVSLAKLALAAEFAGRDTNGPYVVLQDGYDPEDVTMEPGEFILSRSGEWLDMRWFVRMPVADRREGFLFATLAEVMTLMGDLVGPVRVMRGTPIASEEIKPEDDEMNRFISGKG